MRKTELYGQQILAALLRFKNGARAAEAALPKTRPAEETLRLLAEGNTFEQIAKIRGRQIGRSGYGLAGPKYRLSDAVATLRAISSPSSADFR